MPVHSITPGASQLLRDGPRIQVEVGMTGALSGVFQRASVKLPPPLSGFAVIDTGATISGVDAVEIAKLGLAPVDTVNLCGATGKKAAQPVFPVRMEFVGLTLPQVDPIRVFAADGLLREMGLLALIGRDILSKWVFAYDGISGSFTISV